MVARMVPINPDRLLGNLYDLRKFGQYSTGVIRQVYSKADMESRHWLRRQMAEAGLDARLDGLGNVIGYSGKTGPTLLMGSHTDTQPKGGWLDGAYGVICALEVSRALSECPETAHMSVDIASWADEEHTYHGFLGCKGFLGMLPSQVISTAIRSDGHRLEEALKTAGLDGLSEQYKPGRYIGYLESHIEQGPRLDISGNRIGVVTGIVGCRDLDIAFIGETNHAGSTPMAMRKDAGMALIEFVSLLNRRFRQMANQYTVWTIGRVEFLPGAACVIPGQATLRLQFRDSSLKQLDRMEEAVRQMANALQKELKAEIQVEQANNTLPATVDSKIQEVLCQSAEQEVPGQWQSMPSAAMHDASIFARVMPCGMLFVPSIGGVSHSFEEDTCEEDLITGCQVMANAAAEIIRQAS